MNLYSNKQGWKVFLLVLATIIVGVTLWYTNYIASKIEVEERRQIELWSNAIKKRAALVEFTEVLFEQLKNEERSKAELIAKAYKELADFDDQNDLTFVVDVAFQNTTIPMLIYNEDGLSLSKNIPKGRESDEAYIDSLRTAMESKNDPIFFPTVNQYLYYDDSNLFKEIQSVLDDLINSFISETVINSASVPVILTDSTRTQIIRHSNLDSLTISTPLLLAEKLEFMLDENEPIEVVLPEQGRHYVYFENSLILKQLKYFPFIQLILIAVFLLASYLIFSTFRKAEQNQVWVGMAKETAHQLGTPLSSLMAWISILESQGVEKSTIEELNKDVNRLTMITDRFSKIGSKPDLKDENVCEVLESAFGYLKSRVSKKVEFSIHAETNPITAKLSRPLFGWVLENLVKNAIDAMEGKGELSASIRREGDSIQIDIADTGKGIAKGKQKTVFEPGFTTKKRGWGLGLSLTKRIIETYHEGQIFVLRSEPDEGTTFRIILKA